MYECRTLKHSFKVVFTFSLVSDKPHEFTFTNKSFAPSSNSNTYNVNAFTNKYNNKTFRNQRFKTYNKDNPPMDIN